MKKCLHCGAEMPEEEQFCVECGAEFVPEMNNQEVPPEQITETPAVEQVMSGATQSTEDVVVADGVDQIPAVIPEEIKLDEVLDASAEVKGEPVMPVAEKPLKKKKIKWWHIAIPATLVVAIVAVLLLGPFFIYLAPKVVLTKSFTKTFEDLSARADGTPLAVMGKAYDESRKNTVTIEIDAFNQMVGDMRIGIEAKTDSSINQSLINIQANVDEQELDMNMYVDREVAAVNVDLITGKTYYGIYYDTFGEDIRNNEFMYETMGEETVASFEEFADQFGQLINLEMPTPEQRAESMKKYGEVFMEYIEKKDAQVGKAEISLDGKSENCKTVAFTITKEEYAELMLQLIDVAETDPMMLYYYKTNSFDISGEGWSEMWDEEREIFEEYKDGEGTCTITFYLHGGKVVQVDMAAEDDDSTGLLTVSFGSDASVSDIVVRIEGEDDGEEEFSEITLSTKKEGDVVTESLLIKDEDEGEDPFELELGYEWNRKSGDMCLHFRETDGEEGELECVFEELENGFRLSIPAVEDLIESMGENTMGLEMSIDISLTAGAEIEAPKKIKDIAKMTKMDMIKIAMNLKDLVEV